MRQSYDTNTASAKNRNIAITINHTAKIAFFALASNSFTGKHFFGQTTSVNTPLSVTHFLAATVRLRQINIIKLMPLMIRRYRSGVRINYYLCAEINDRLIPMAKLLHSIARYPVLLTGITVAHDATTMTVNKEQLHATQAPCGGQRSVVSSFASVTCPAQDYHY